MLRRMLFLWSAISREYFVLKVFARIIVNNRPTRCALYLHKAESALDNRRLRLTDARREILGDFLLRLGDTAA